MIKGCPAPRDADRKGFAVLLTTTGIVPSCMRVLCNGATREMNEQARLAFNTKVIGKLYRGAFITGGLSERDKTKAYDMGCELAERIRSDRSS